MRIVQKLRTIKISPSAVAAYLALFLALTGTAYAAGTINGTEIITGSMPLNRLEKSVVKGKGKMDAGTRTVPANTTDPSLFTLQGFGDMKVYDNLTSENPGYCPSNPGVGGQGFVVYTNTTAETQTLWVNGGKVLLASNSRYEDNGSNFELYVVAGDKIASVDMQSVGDLNEAGTEYASCSFVWTYWTSNN